MKIHYSTRGILSGSLDIHSKRSDHWRHYPTQEWHQWQIEWKFTLFFREYTSNIISTKHKAWYISTTYIQLMTSLLKNKVWLVFGNNITNLYIGRIGNEALIQLEFWKTFHITKWLSCIILLLLFHWYNICMLF